MACDYRYTTSFIDFWNKPFFTDRTSTYIDFYKIRGVQLLPNNQYPYIQTTNLVGGIYLEDWTVYVVNTWDDTETDITDYFSVDNAFFDDNGDKQFSWSLTNVPFDFGYDLVYLKVVQTLGETFYSNYFMLTDTESEKTCRLDYKDDDNDVMQSIQIRMAYLETLKNQEIDSYYETSTKNTVTNVIKSQKYENWLTDIISKDLIIKISDIFEYKYTYVDLYRCNLFEAVDINEIEADENFSEQIIKLAFNKTDGFSPAYLPLGGEITWDDDAITFDDTDITFDMI